GIPSRVGVRVGDDGCMDFRNAGKNNLTKLERRMPPRFNWGMKPLRPSLLPAPCSGAEGVVYWSREQTFLVFGRKSDAVAYPTHWRFTQARPLVCLRGPTAGVSCAGADAARPVGSGPAGVQCVSWPGPYASAAGA